MTLAKRSLTSARVARLPASGIRRFFDLAAGIPGVISLGVGEPDFVTPDAFRDAAVRSIKEGKTHQLRNSLLTGHRDGMVSFEQSLSFLVGQGLVSYEDAVARSLHPADVNRPQPIPVSMPMSVAP